MLKISDKVLNALKENKPVVALETTIISHGMPYPENINTALAVEKVIEDNGAIPATIGIIDGVAIIGMNHEEIKQFGLRKDIKKWSKKIALNRLALCCVNGYEALSVLGIITGAVGLILSTSPIVCAAMFFLGFFARRYYSTQEKELKKELQQAKKVGAKSLKRVKTTKIEARW